MYLSIRKMKAPILQEKKFPPSNKASSGESYLRRSAEIAKKKVPCDLSVQINSNEPEIEEQSQKKRQRTTMDEKQCIYSESVTPRIISRNEQQIRLMKIEKELEQSVFLIKEKQKRIDILCEIIKGKNIQIEQKNKREQFLLENQRKLNEKFVAQKEKISKLMFQFELVTEKKNGYEIQNESLKKINISLKQQIEKVRETPEISTSESIFYQEYQQKVNKLVEEKYKLQSKIHHLESAIQQNEFQISSLNTTLQAYECRQKYEASSPILEEVEILRNKVSQLQERNHKIQQDHSFEIMKLENIIDQIKQNKENKPDNTSVNQILKDQIKQIQFLRQKLRYH